MQIKKDEIKAAILAAAKKEFLDFGYEKASLRRIAACSDLSKGGIYAYFKNKNELFCTIVQPAMSYLTEAMQNYSNDKYLKYYGVVDADLSEESIKGFSEFVKGLVNFKYELTLLFFKSSGSELENYREVIFKMRTDQHRDFYVRWSELHPEYNFKVSEMLIHSHAAMYLSLIEEIIVHEPDDKEFEIYIKQMAIFVHQGMIHVMRMNLPEND